METINERDQYKTALDYQNASLLHQKAEYDKKLYKLPTEITKIRTKYEVIYAGIDDFKKESNETDCQSADRFLRTFNY